MQFDAHLRSPDVEKTAKRAGRAESLNFDGAWVTEVDHSPVVLSTEMVNGTDSIDIGTAIAVAFPRSPMVTAYTAWDLQSLSDGRFMLGLGTQVKGHIERRFSETWDAPGPRLRDYVKAVQHLWDAWATESEVDYHGEYYTIDLCPPEFTPERITNPHIPIYVAGVNSFNIQLAGHLCDGLHLHPVHSPAYIREKVLPFLEQGADHGSRNRSDVTIAASVFAITGETKEEIELAREEVRREIGFYGSTRTYKTIFEVHGWEKVSDELHALSKAGRWDEMSELVTDEMLEAFAVEGHWDELRSLIEKRYEHVDRVSVYRAFDGGDYWHKLMR